MGSRAATIWLLSVLGLAASRDHTGEELLEKCKRALTGVTSLQASFIFEGKSSRVYGKEIGTFALMRPNRVHQMTTTPDGMYGRLVVNCDGKQLILYGYGRNDVTRVPAGKPGSTQIVDYVIETPTKDHVLLRLNDVAKVILDPTILDQARESAKPTIGKELVIDSVPCQCLEFIKGEDYQRYYIAPDGIVRGYQSSTDGIVETCQIHEVKIGAKLPVSTFQWKPPKGSKLYVPQAK